MKIVPHALCYRGFYTEFDPKSLGEKLSEFLDRKAELFSFGTREGCESRVRCMWRITTSDESIEPDESSGEQAAVFCRELSEHPWVYAQIRLEHALRLTGGLSLHLTEIHRGEVIEMKIDDEVGSFEIEARLSSNERTRVFIEGIVSSLTLSEKPQKHSRDVPAWLETKLLCDSLHMCNICRGEDVIIHHIIPVEDQGETVEDNLIVLCTSHHGTAHTKRQLTKNLKPDHLREYKMRHLQWVKDLRKPQSLGSIQNRDEEQTAMQSA